MKYSLFSFCFLALISSSFAQPLNTANPQPVPNSTTVPVSRASPAPATNATPVPVSTATPAPVPRSNPTQSVSMNNISLDTLTLDKKDGINLTLEESVRLAVEKSTEVLKAENDVHFSGTRLLQAYGQFLPNLIGTGAYNYETGRTYSTVADPVYIQGSGQNAGYGLTADLNIFNGLSDFSNLRSSLLKKDASDLTVTRAKQEILLDVSQTFLQVILDNKLVTIAKKNLQASQERERLLKEQTDVGARNLSDLFRQQAQTSIDESNLLSAQNKTRTDQIILMRKIRVEVAQNYHFIEPNLPDRPSQENMEKEDSLVAHALEQRVDLKASKENADATSWDVHAAFGNYLPKLDLIAGLQSVGHHLNDQLVNGIDVVPPTQTSMSTQLGRQIEYTIGIQLTWSIFDRFVTAENVSRARVISDDATIDAEDRKLQVQGEVRQAYGDYLTAVQQLKTSKKGFESAQKAYEVMDGRYSVGAASFLDLITAQSVLVQAESNRAQALINFQLQEKSLAFATGDLAVK